MKRITSRTAGHRSAKDAGTRKATAFRTTLIGATAISGGLLCGSCSDGTGTPPAQSGAATVGAVASVTARLDSPPPCQCTEPPDPCKDPAKPPKGFDLIKCDPVIGKILSLTKLAGDISGYFTAAGAAFNTAVSLLQAMGILDTPPDPVATALHELRVRIDRNTSDLSWQLRQERREDHIKALESLVATTTDQIVRNSDGRSSDPIDWGRKEDEAGDELHELSGSDSFQRFFIETDTDGPSIRQPGRLGGSYTWKDLIPHSDADLEREGDFAYDWRLGLTAYMQAIALREKLFAMQDPHFATNGTFFAELGLMDPILRDIRNKMEAGFRCGEDLKILDTDVTNPHVDPHEGNPVQFGFVEACADIYSGISLIKDFTYNDTFSYCCPDVCDRRLCGSLAQFPVRFPDGCTQTCTPDKDRNWTAFTESVKRQKEMIRQEARNLTPWFELQSMIDTVYAQLNRRHDLTNTVDGKVHAGGATDLCLTGPTGDQLQFATLEGCADPDYTALQEWKYNRSTQALVNVSTGLCMEAADCLIELPEGGCPEPTESTVNKPMIFRACDGRDAQRWSYSFEDSRLYNARGMVLAVPKDAEHPDGDFHPHQVPLANLKEDGPNQQWTQSPTAALVGPQPNGAHGWFNSAATAELAATAAAPGSTIQWGFSSSLGNTYSGPITLPEGNSTIYYRLVNANGTAESTRLAEYHVDTHAPTATARLSANYTMLTLTGIDASPGSGVSKLHALVTTGTTAAPEQVVSGATGTLSVDPNFTSIEYWAEDSAGNQSTHAFVSNYAKLVLQDGPAGYWRLDETSGTTAADLSVTPHAGAYVGTHVPYAPALNQAGAIAGDADTSAYFSFRNDAHYNPQGQTTWVDIPDNTTQQTNEFTLECWFTQKSGYTPQTYAALMEKTSNNGSDGYGLFEYAGNIYFYVNNSYTPLIRISGVPYPAPDTYHHIVATYDRHFMRLYFDGVEASNRPYTAAVNAGTGSLMIGRGWIYLGWAGLIDEPAFYNKALDEKHIRNHYLAGTGKALIP